MSCTIIKRPYSGCITQGDTIPSLPFTFASGIDLTGATINMQVYWNGSKKIDISNGSGITIDNALKFTIDERAQSESILPIGKGIGDIEFTFASGIKETLFSIEYTITKEETK